MWSFLTTITLSTSLVVETVTLLINGPAILAGTPLRREVLLSHIETRMILIGKEATDGVDGAVAPDGAIAAQNRVRKKGVTIGWLDQTQE